jgi:hypothetical protein
VKIRERCWLIAGSWQTQPISSHGSKSVELEVYATLARQPLHRQRQNGYLRLDMVPDKDSAANNVMPIKACSFSNKSNVLSSRKCAIFSYLVHGSAHKMFRFVSSTSLYLWLPLYCPI